MINDIWINLPVKNIEKSKIFFAELGFEFNKNYGNSPTSACLLIGQKNVVVMLFEEPAFKSFTQHGIADTKLGNEVLFSIGAESREEVDEIVKKVAEAGGTVFATPGEKDGWLYGCGFCDLDGHRWNVIYMDMSKMPKG